MAKQTKNTFGAMSSFLRSLGYVPARRGSSIVFTHPHGGPLILFPEYKSGQVVRPIHRMMVKHQLLDAGLIEPDQFDIPTPPKAPTRPKKTSESVEA